MDRNLFQKCASPTGTEKDVLFRSPMKDSEEIVLFLLKMSFHTDHFLVFAFFPINTLKVNKETMSAVFTFISEIVYIASNKGEGEVGEL